MGCSQPKPPVVCLETRSVFFIRSEALRKTILMSLRERNMLFSTVVTKWKPPTTGSNSKTTTSVHPVYHNKRIHCKFGTHQTVTTTIAQRDFTITPI